MSHVVGSQTLSRGIEILELLSESSAPMGIDDAAQKLGVHRSNAYRLVRTLEAHGLVVRGGQGQLSLGPRLAALAAGVSRDLQAEALPELTEAANELGMTCFIVVLDHDESVTLTSVEPRHQVATVAQRPGARHALDVGAPGRAILAQLPPEHWPDGVPERVRSDVGRGSEAGFHQSFDEVMPNLHAVAVPLPLRARAPAAVGAVYVASPHPPAEIGARLQRVAAGVATALGEASGRWRR